MLADWFQLPSHGNVGTCSRLPGVYRDLPRLAEVPEFEWSVPMVLMPFVRLLRSQDFVPFVLLCLALALPRGCMWLQAALVGVCTSVVSVVSGCVSFCVFCPVQSSRSAECWQLHLSAFHVFQHNLKISQISQFEISLGEAMGNPCGIWCDLMWHANFVHLIVSGRASATASSMVHWSPWWMTHALQDAAVMWSPWMPRWEARPSLMELRTKHTTKRVELRLAKGY